MLMRCVNCNGIAGFLFGALILIQAVPSRADPLLQLAEGAPAASLMCGGVHNALQFTPDYLDYDPQTAPSVMELPLKVLMVGPPLYSAPWIPNPFDAGGFRDADRKGSESFMNQDETYDQTYRVYHTGLDFYGEGQPRQVFRATYLRSSKLPRIFVEHDGSALAEGLDKLGASDVLTYGPRAYPVVRKPGEVIVYEIDTDLPGQETFEQKKFIPNVICDYYDINGPAAAAHQAAPAPAPAPAPTPAAAPTPPPAPAAVPPPAGAAPSGPDPCAQLQAINPSYYAVCENKIHPGQQTP